MIGLRHIALVTVTSACLAGGAALALNGGPAAAGAPSTVAPAPAATAAPGSGEFPDSFYYMDRKTGKRYARPAALEGRPAPVLKLNRWQGKAQDIKKLKGKVVVVDFWATWCGPCVRSIPKNIKMVKELGPEGLVFLGVHDSRRGFETMPQMVKSKGINYSVGVDIAGASVKNYGVSFWPTYVVIDRNGKVRAAGVRPDKVETVVRKLLKEKAEPVAAPTSKPAG